MFSTQDISQNSFKQIHEVFYKKIYGTYQQYHNILAAMNEYHQFLDNLEAITRDRGSIFSSQEDIQAYQEILRLLPSTRKMIKQLQSDLLNVVAALNELTKIFISHPIYIEACRAEFKAKEKEIEQYVYLLKQVIEHKAFLKLESLIRNIQIHARKESDFEKSLIAILNKAFEHKNFLPSYIQLEQSIQKSHPSLKSSSALSAILDVTGQAPRFFPSIVLCLRNAQEKLPKDRLSKTCLLQFNKALQIAAEVAQINDRFVCDVDHIPSQSTQPLSSSTSHLIAQFHTSAMTRDKPKENILTKYQPEVKRLVGGLNHKKYEDMTVIIEQVKKIKYLNLLQAVYVELQKEQYQYIRNCGFFGCFTRYRSLDGFKTSKTWYTVESTIVQQREELKTRGFKKTP